MSIDKRQILEVIPPGTGSVLDLGGSTGMLRQPLEQRGYRYINLDCRRFGHQEPTLIGDAHQLCFKDQSVSLIVSKCTFEHFSDPWQIVRELYRVLKVGGRGIIWVPFIHPFHGSDYYRYTPLGLKHLFRDFRIIAFDSPTGMFTVLGTAASELLRRIGFCGVHRIVAPVAHQLDRIVMGNNKRLFSYAAAYRIVIQKGSETGLISESHSHPASNPVAGEV